MLFAAALVVAVAVGVSSASPGALDPTFGSGGKVTTSFGAGYDEIDDMALQPDGKIVAGGYVEPTTAGATFGLARYKPSGALDTTFGTGGRVTTALGSRSWVNAVLVQPDAKIVAIGYVKVGTETRFGVARYNAAGGLDTSFGTGGKVTTDVGSSGTTYAAVLQPDGKIVAVGVAQNGSRFELVRYNPDGSLDTSFGTNGKVATSFGAGGTYAFGAALQPDGKILAGGFHYNTGGLYHFALARYNANGSLDTSFGTGGKVVTAIGSSHSVGRVVALQSDGKIVMGGYSYNGATYDLTLVRYHTNGTLDPSFGSGGKVLTSFGAGWRSSVNELLIQPNGKIVAVGYARKTEQDFFVVARYLATGALDTSFGSGGKVKTSFGTIDDYAGAAVLQPDGKIVAGGAVTKTPDYVDADFGLARYQGDSHTLAIKIIGNAPGRVATEFGTVDCTHTCTAEFADASTATLLALPPADTGITESWVQCPHVQFPEANKCDVEMTSDKMITARFERCVVPKLKGRKLKGAKKLLRRHGCSLGKVKRRHSARAQKGRVISQKPKAGAKKPFGYRVKVTLSKGP
jgi:uncharacterized delta-60 repeat protein